MSARLQGCASEIIRLQCQSRCFRWTLRSINPCANSELSCSLLFLESFPWNCNLHLLISYLLFAARHKTPIMGAVLSFVTGFVAPVFIIVSPITSYADQIAAIYRSKSSAGFSLDIPLIMLLASILRYVLLRTMLTPCPYLETNKCTC